jgi:hypothetical protein
MHPLHKIAHDVGTKETRETEGHNYARRPIPSVGRFSMLRKARRGAIHTSAQLEEAQNHLMDLSRDP